VLSKQIALPAAGAESPSIGAGNFIWQPRHLTRTPKLHSLHLSPVVATSHIMMMRKCRVHLFSDSVMVQESGFRIWNGGWGMLDSGLRMRCISQACGAAVVLGCLQGDCP